MDNRRKLGIKSTTVNMKKIVLWSLLGFGLIQLVPVDHTNQPVNPQKDFAELLKTPKEVKQLLVTSCYDCHSYQVKYPKYAFVAPISWSIEHHVKEGREHANFSEWSGYNKEQKEHVLEEVIETIERKEMPLKGYLPLHPEANLTDAQRKVLIDYFKQIKQSGIY